MQLHTTLLKLLSADRAGVEAVVERLDREIAIAGLDDATRRLLATVFPALRDTLVPTPLRKEAAMSYLANTRRNRGTFASLAPVVDALAHAGCRPTFLKGVAMVLAQYRDMGLRSFGDADLLVSPERARTAWEVIEQSGGVPERRGRLARFDDVRDAHHAWLFMLPGDLAIDLHWSPLSACCSDSVAQRFLEHAKPVSFGGLSGLVPPPAYLLFHAVVHAARRETSSGRWLFDAARLVGHTPDLHWDSAWSLARDTGLSHAFASGLDALHQALERPSPWSARPPVRASLWQRVELWSWQRDALAFKTTPVARVLFHVSRYRRLRKYHPAWSTRGWRAYWQAYRDEKPVGSVA